MWCACDVKRVPQASPLFSSCAVKPKQAATEKQMTNFDLPMNRAVSTPRQAVVGQAVRGHTHRNCRPTTVQCDVTTERAGSRWSGR